jgi:hypothetical protein
MEVRDMLKNLDNKTLLTEISDLVKKEKRTTLEILDYLSEIDERRLFLEEGYSSLFDFCVRFLNYSEGEALRRIQASRATKKVEEVKQLLHDNELSLTGLSLIAPHLKAENAATLLPAVKNKSKREIEKIIVETFPEAKPKPELLTVLLDPELKHLIEAAKRKVSEKDLAIVLKRALKEFVRERAERRTPVKKHTRYVPISLRREVMRSSNFQCTFTSPQGVRCNQTAHLEIDHVRPWAKGGSSHDSKNLRVLCKSHNLMFARRQFKLTPKASHANPLAL